jgi:hypothetical protein
MYKRLTAISAFSLLLLTFLVLWLFAWPKGHDRNVYRDYSNKTKKFSPTAICQNRLKVCKDIWFSQAPETRLHYRIESASSALTFEPRGTKIDIIEHLEQMRCWMQDKITPGASVSQQARYFTAREGTYNFLSQQLLADKATLSLYRMPGDRLPEIGRMPSCEPFLAGEAATVAFSVAGNTPKFQANDFKASMSPKE